MEVKSLGANQTEVEINGRKVLFSYETSVAYKEDGKAYITSQKWSKTTSKHVSQWVKGMTVFCIPQEQFDTLVK